MSENTDKVVKLLLDLGFKKGIFATFTKEMIYNDLVVDVSAWKTPIRYWDTDLDNKREVFRVDQDVPSSIETKTSTKEALLDDIGKMIKFLEASTGVLSSGTVAYQEDPDTSPLGTKRMTYSYTPDPSTGVGKIATKLNFDKSIWIVIPSNTTGFFLRYTKVVHDIRNQQPTDNVYLDYLNEEIKTSITKLRAIQEELGTIRRLTGEQR